jgi:hypothetical protein
MDAHAFAAVLFGAAACVVFALWVVSEARIGASTRRASSPAHRQLGDLLSDLMPLPRVPPGGKWTQLDSPNAPSGGASSGDVAGWSAAMVDGATPALDLWARWHSVDEHVLAAFAHLAREPIDGVADLLRVVDAREYLVSSQAFHRMLAGHVAEFVVHDHVVGAGLEAVMPQSSNAPGIDLWVEGHGVQVKAWSDAAAGVAAHLDRYPDIPVVVPADAGGIPEGALFFDPSEGIDPSLFDGAADVLVDSALSHADVTAQTAEALDVVQDPGPHAQLPLITLVLAGVREARLLTRGDTSVPRAAKNVVIDGLAVGGYGAAGLKVGATAGALLGPVGAAVLGAVGGVIGAAYGRSRATAMKRAPLEAAAKAYEERLRAYRQVESVVSRDLDEKWSAALAEEQSALDAALAQLRDTSTKLYQAGSSALGAIAVVDPSRLRALVTHAEAELAQELDATTAQIEGRVPRGLGWMAGLVVPDLVSRRRIAARRLDELGAIAHEASPGTTWPILEKLLDTPGGERAVRAIVTSAAHARKFVYEELARTGDAIARRTIELRATSIDRLRTAWTKARDEAETKLQPSVRALKQAHELLGTELRSAGIAPEGPSKA